MNFVLHGHSVSTGITIGQAHLVSSARLEVAHYEIEEREIATEISRFDAAMHAAREELSELKAHIPAGSLDSVSDEDLLEFLRIAVARHGRQP